MARRRGKRLDVPCRSCHEVEAVVEWVRRPDTDRWSEEPVPATETQGSGRLVLVTGRGYGAGCGSSGTCGRESSAAGRPERAYLLRGGLGVRLPRAAGGLYLRYSTRAGLREGVFSVASCAGRPAATGRTAASSLRPRRSFFTAGNVLFP